MPKTIPKTTRNWTPVRRGHLYCSPSCGGGCTHEAYLTAKLKAERLARQCGNGWKPRVWENLGWHYAATSRGNHVKVHPYGRGMQGYTVFFGWPEGSGGDYTTQDTSIKRALANGLAVARQKAKDAQDLVRDLEEAIS